MARRHTRNYEERSQNWWDYFFGAEPSSRRRPWLVNAMVAMVIGLFLGGGVAFQIANGYFPYGGLIGVAGLIFQVLIVGLGQLYEPTRLGLRDLARIGIVGLAGFIVALVVGLLLTM